MRIVGFIGFQGSGKTLSMTHQLHRKKVSGRQVATNYKTTFSDWTIPPPVILEDGTLNYGEIRDTALGFQELHAWFDSYCSMSDINRVLSYFFTQLRKRKNDFFFDTQHFGQVGKRLRDNTHYLCLCESIVKECKPLTSHAPGEGPYADDYGARCRSCKYFVKQAWFKAPFWDRMPARNVLFLRQEPIWALYDTEEILNPSIQRNPPKQRVKGRRTNPSDPDTFQPLLTEVRHATSLPDM